jgi:methionyl aminopeptidase
MNYIDAKTAPSHKTNAIRLYDAEAFEHMRRVSQLTAQALDLMVEHVKAGVTTNQLDQIAHEFARDHGAYPAPLFYRGFPKSICTSVNHVICHGIPDDKPLKEGDIINIDITLILNGWHGDASRMYYVGEVNRKAQRLCEVTYESLLRAIAVVKHGARLGDIGYAIQSYVEAERFSVVREFCGHGLGQLFHDEPNVMHFGKQGTGPELRAGMIFTIEPMINAGKPPAKMLDDGWTAVTRDRSLSAQFEHTLGITETGVEIFTRSPKGLDFPAHPQPMV